MGGEILENTKSNENDGNCSQSNPSIFHLTAIYLSSLSLSLFKLLSCYGSIGNSGQSCLLKITMSDIQNITDFNNEWSRVLSLSKKKSNEIFTESK
jgi:hypothetical protein